MNELDKAANEHVEDLDPLKDEAVLTENARIATEKEHNLTVVQAFRAYPWAVFWCFFVSMSIVMEGYSYSLMGNFQAFPSFKEKYGQYFADIDEYQIPGPWQVALLDAASIGTFFGTFLNGYLSSAYGHKRVMLVSLVVLTGLLFLMFFSESVQVLFVSQLLCGIPWGIFATIGPAYAAEVCPTVLRVYLTSYTNLCFATGQLVAAAALLALVNNTTQWSYRIPFALQWIWPMPLFCVLLFAPESPYWLVRKGRIEEAKHSVRRLLSKRTDIDATEVVSMMVRTNEIEKEVQANQTYWSCFKGVDLRRTEISCISFAGQVLSGSHFAYSPTYFFEQAGMATDKAYKLNVGDSGIAFCGTVLSWFLINRLGRRTVYLAGISTLTVLLLLVGFISLAPKDNQSALWAQAAFTMLWLFVFSTTIGPVGWAIPSETASTRLRQQTLCLARNTYYIANIVTGVLEPYMINPTSWNWQGKTAFFWAGTAFLTTVWAYFRLPEVQGRTYEELDILFNARVSARKFRSAQVDAYTVDEDKVKQE